MIDCKDKEHQDAHEYIACFYLSSSNHHASTGEQLSSSLSFLVTGDHCLIRATGGSQLLHASAPLSNTGELGCREQSVLN